MKKLRLLCFMLLGCLCVIGSSASAAGKMTMDRDKALTNLTNNFQYDRNELAGFLDKGWSYVKIQYKLK